MDVAKEGTEEVSPLGFVGPCGPLGAADQQRPKPRAGTFRKQITEDKADYETKVGPFQDCLTLFSVRETLSD